MLKTVLSSTAVLGLVMTLPGAANAQYHNSSYNSQDECKRAEDQRQVVGGLIGAVAGGVLGSQVSGNGARTEGSAIGAVLGGLAGAGIADKQIDCGRAHSSGYHSGTTQRQSSYGTSDYSSGSSYGTQTYGGQTYQNQDQSYGTTSSTAYYPDQVTVSNHPVYSDPTYGAGAVRSGTSYSTGTVSYPPGSSYQPAPTTSYSTNQTYQSVPSTSYSSPQTYQSVPSTSYSSPQTYQSVPSTSYSTGRTYSPSYPSTSSVVYVSSYPSSTYYGSSRRRHYGHRDCRRGWCKGRY